MCPDVNNVFLLFFLSLAPIFYNQTEYMINQNDDHNIFFLFLKIIQVDKFF